MKAGPGGGPDSGTPDSGTPGPGSRDSGTPGPGSRDSGTPGSGTPGPGSRAARRREERGGRSRSFVRVLGELVLAFVRPRGWRQFAVGLFLAALGIGSLLVALPQGRLSAAGTAVAALAAVGGTLYVAACVRSFGRDARGRP